MISVQERAVIDTSPSSKVSLPVAQLAKRFNDLRKLLTGDGGIAYSAGQFLVQRQAPPEFIARFSNPDIGFQEFFSTSRPWELFYSVTVLSRCVVSYSAEKGSNLWVPEFGARHYLDLIKLLENLSTSEIGSDLRCSTLPVISILDAYMNDSMNRHELANNRYPRGLDCYPSRRSTRQDRLRITALARRLQPLCDNSAAQHPLQTVVPRPARMA
jgi:hypothetical protein